MTLGMEVDLGPGDIVLDRDPPTLAKGAQQPSLFRPMSAVATVAQTTLISATAELLL